MPPIYLVEMLTSFSRLTADKDDHGTVGQQGQVKGKRVELFQKSYKLDLLK